MAPRFPNVAIGAALARGPRPGRRRWPGATSPYVSPSQARMKEDVGFLAADAQEGRAPGTKGIEASADYIAASFKESGLKPAPGRRRATSSRSRSGATPELTELRHARLQGAGRARRSSRRRTAFQPLAIGSGGELEGVPIVFAGYGITAKDDAKKLDYDDYAGIDVKGKAVLVIRREPQLDDEKSPFAGKRRPTYATFTHKATNAFQHGAAPSCWSTTWPA